MSDEGWAWQFRTPAKRAYDGLDEHAQNWITDKFDEIGDEEWREPDTAYEPSDRASIPSRQRMSLK